MGVGVTHTNLFIFPLRAETFTHNRSIHQLNAVFLVSKFTCLFFSLFSNIVAKFTYFLLWRQIAVLFFRVCFSVIDMSPR